MSSPPPPCCLLPQKWDPDCVQSNVYNSTSAPNGPNISVRAPLCKYKSSLDESHLSQIVMWLPRMEGGGKIRTRSRVHERTVSLRFLGIILRVLRLEISIDKCLHYKPLSNHFCLGGAGGEKLVRRGDCEYQRGKLLRILSFELHPRIRPQVVPLLTHSTFYKNYSQKQYP